jgi:hypothetical protein
MEKRKKLDGNSHVHLKSRLLNGAKKLKEPKKKKINP